MVGESSQDENQIYLNPTFQKVNSGIRQNPEGKLKKY